MHRFLDNQIQKFGFIGEQTEQWVRHALTGIELRDQRLHEFLHCGATRLRQSARTFARLWIKLNNDGIHDYSSPPVALLYTLPHSIQEYQEPLSGSASAPLPGRTRAR